MSRMWTEKIRRINETMDAYLKGSVFRTLENTLLYIERTQSDGKIRRGLIGMVDLERYDYTPGSGALIRATEGTVLARIPPRVKVRREAPIELPHVMLLIDDPQARIIEPLAEKKAEMEQIYAFPLMQGGGRVAGWRMTPGQMAGAAGALAALADPRGDGAEIRTARCGADAVCRRGRESLACGGKGML